MKTDWREGDIVTWWFTKDELKSRNHGNNGGTTYWCCSQIATFKNGRFWDTYWYGPGSDNKNFSPDVIGVTIKVNFVANFDELDKQASDNQYFTDLLYKQYDINDIVNLNHPNNSRGNLYLRKGAKKRIDIIEQSYIYRIKELEDKIKSLQYDLEKTKEEFGKLTEDNYEEHKIWLR